MTDEKLEKFKLERLLREYNLRKKTQANRVLEEFNDYDTSDIEAFLRKKGPGINFPVHIVDDDSRKNIPIKPATTLQETVEERFSRSIALVCNTSAILDHDDTYYRLNVRSLKSSIVSIRAGIPFPLCDSERFAKQPAGNFATGFVYSEGVIATAKHNLGLSRTPDNPIDIRFVFGYQTTDEKGETWPGSEDPKNPRYDGFLIERKNVFRCSGIFAQPSAGSTLDWMLLNMTGDVSSRSPLERNTDSNIANETDLYVMGYPSGLPLKHAGGAKVKSSTNTHFLAPLDTFGGNSGSPVFNKETNKVVGILVGPQTDYETAHGKNCSIAKVVNSNDQLFIECLKITQIP